MSHKAKEDRKEKLSKDPWKAVKKASEEAVQSVKKAMPTTKVLQKQDILKNGTAQMQPTPKVHLKFSLKNFNFTEQLPAIAEDFSEEIKILQRHTFTISDPCMLVAKILISNNESIESETFEIVRRTIIEVIGEYQNFGMDTPIFHDISNNGTDITLICENNYAYTSLELSVEDICQLQLIPHLISITKMSPVSHVLYCYVAIYEGVVDDPKLFLMQTKLHKPMLEADHWITVSHEVFTEKKETHFIFLIDEQSSLMLNYRFDNKLLICMRQVQFTLKGQLPATGT